MLARILAVLGLMTLGLLTNVSAQEAIDVGDRVELKATNPAGVPLHGEARPSMFGRAPDGSIGMVEEVQAETNWIRLQLDDGRGAWIVRKYVARVLEGGEPPVDTSQDALAVWSSREQCEQVVSAGRRMAAQQPDTIRMAAWNIRWFPDGTPENDPTKATDLPWLACAIAWMNVDVVALEEIRITAAASNAWVSVTDGLFGLTGQNWEVDLQSCGPESSQHVGFLWNTARVGAAGNRDEWRLNGAAEGEHSPCGGNLRPGRYAYFTAVQANGLDVHLLAVHLDSGRTDRDRGHRRIALERINEAAEPLLARDADVIILGDFNTMGTDSGESAEQEIESMRATVAQEVPGFAPLNVEPQCTEYFDGHGGWLDHVLEASQMTEAPAQTAVVTGYCALANCDPLDSNAMPPAYERLSDHCPVVFNLDNADRD